MSKFTFPTPVLQSFNGDTIESIEELNIAVSDLRSIPDRYKEVLNGLTSGHLDQKTENGIWTIRQVVHHTADSHLNAFSRFKYALTLDSPEIIPAPESEWAKFPDTLVSPVEYSLDILSGVHNRWADTLSGLPLEMLSRNYYHPDDNKSISIAMQIPMYIWHGNYHLGFIMRTLL